MGCWSGNPEATPKALSTVSVVGSSTNTRPSSSLGSSTSSSAPKPTNTDDDDGDEGSKTNVGAIVGGTFDPTLVMLGAPA